MVRQDYPTNSPSFYPDIIHSKSDVRTSEMIHCVIFRRLSAILTILANVDNRNLPDMLMHDHTK
jgi:hypothetical protein